MPKDYTSRFPPQARVHALEIIEILRVFALKFPKQLSRKSLMNCPGREAKAE
jgi:hypothetical protein